VMEDRDLAVALPQLNIVKEYDSGIGCCNNTPDAPAIPTKDRPREGGFWMVCRELVLKLRHGLQFILGGRYTPRDRDTNAYWRWLWWLSWW